MVRIYEKLEQLASDYAASMGRIAMSIEEKKAAFKQWALRNGLENGEPCALTTFSGDGYFRYPEWQIAEENPEAIPPTCPSNLFRVDDPTVIEEVINGLAKQGVTTGDKARALRCYHRFLIQSHGIEGGVEVDLQNTISPKSNEVGNSVALNTVLYGPPGTGKTYNTMAYAVAICDDLPIDAERGYVGEFNREGIEIRYEELRDEGQIEFVTFHQSYSYEDFIEGIKPVMGSMGENGGDVSYVIEDGVFKRFCKLDKGFDEAWKDLVEEVGVLEIEEKRLTIPTKTGASEFDLTLSASSSTGFKAYSKSGKFLDYFNKDQCFKVYNHLPGVESGAHDEYREAILDYMVKNHGLMSHSQGNAANKNRVIIIDEINRGNISRIFGELITLLEEDKRANEEGVAPYQAKLPYSKELFAVPSNVYVLGTMNTADRSLTQIDTALRRRFEFVEVMPQPGLLNKRVMCDDGSEIDLGKMLTAINERIAVLRDREHTIGHSYFMRNDGEALTFEELKHRFANKVIPLLQEYFYDDYGNIKKVLGEAESETGFIATTEGGASYIWDDLEIDNVRTYEFTPEDSWKPKMFIGIYEQHAGKGNS